MKRAARFPDPRSMHVSFDETDIVSGEKSPSQHETDELIRQIPLLASQDEDSILAQGETETAADGRFELNEGDAPDMLDAARKIEHDSSLSRDEPDLQLDELDPVPPEGP